METAPSPWWDSARHADRRPFLLARNRIAAAVRSYFEMGDFVEVACGALAVSPGNEAHLHAFATTMVGPEASATPLYLHTSPEFACKKLLAAGERRIFDLARVYRNRERGPLHAPEFTMLEWYRAEEPYDAVVADACALLRVAADAAEAHALTYRGHAVAVERVPERVSVADAFQWMAGIDLLATLGDDGTPDAAALKRAAQAAGVAAADDDTWSDVFSRVLVAKVEPKLGFDAPTILDRYPVCEAALARRTPDDARVAERFELYVCGVELANGFGELTDAAEQRRRFEAEMDEKERVYGRRYPLDEDFLAALARMPAASGVALGFERLVMLATGAPHIDMVLWTPAPPAG